MIAKLAQGNPRGPKLRIHSIETHKNGMLTNPKPACLFSIQDTKKPKIAIKNDK